MTAQESGAPGEYSLIGPTSPPCSWACFDAEHTSAAPVGLFFQERA
jgi:hypothetical protein